MTSTTGAGLDEQWLSLGVGVLVTVVILLGIGVPLARAIGLRGFNAIAIAPAFTMTIVCGSSVILPWLGIPWTPWAVAGVAVIAALILFGLRLLTRRYRPAPLPRRNFDRWLLVAFLIAAVLIAVRTIIVIQAPDRISQTFDNVFHLNAMRWILDTGSASSFEIGYMTNPSGPPTFYPAAWHALGTLVAQLSGAAIPVVINAVVLTVSAIVWPMSILLLSRTLLGRSPALAVSVGLVSASVPGFPLAMMDFGVLYPFQLGLALVPIALTITAKLLRLVADRDRLGTLWWSIALVAVLAALALVHPGALMAWLALSAPMAVVFVVVSWRRGGSRRYRIVLLSLTVAYLVLAAAMVYVLRPPGEARGWQPEMSMNSALVKVMTASPWYAHAPILVAIGVLLGIVWALLSRRPSVLAALGMYVVGAILFVAAAALPFPFRDLLTAPWYNNIPRLAAIFTVTLVPLAAYGFSQTWALAARRLRRREWSTTSIRVSGAVLLALIGFALQAGPLSAMPEAQRVASWSYALTDDSPLLSADEAALLERLGDHVPPDVAIAGSPWTGTSVAYALTGRHVLMPHILMEISAELEMINEGLADAKPGSAVCDAIEQLSVGFVLDFGEREVHGADHDFPGLDNLSDSGSVRLVDREGDARLYEVTACGR